MFETKKEIIPIVLPSHPKKLLYIVVRAPFGGESLSWEGYILSEAHNIIQKRMFSLRTIGNKQDNNRTAQTLNRNSNELDEIDLRIG